MQISIVNGAVSYDGVPILTEINFDIHDKEKIALVGRNGCGKTTLLKVLCGQVEMEQGVGSSPLGFFTSGKPRLGYLEQVTFAEEKTLYEEVLSAYQDVLQVEADLASALLAMQQNPTDQTAKRYTDLLNTYDYLGGYTYQKECKTAIVKFGFEGQENKPLSQFSGGQRSKIALLKTLLSRPDVLLLDEPTNHLDIQAVEWLENFLKNYKKSFVVVSHDRMFLDRIVNVVYEIEYGEMTRYSGNYTHFLSLKQMAFEKAKKDAEQKAKEIARLEKIVERFRYKATKAQMAQAKLSQIKRLGAVIMPNRFDNDTFKANFQPSVATVNKTLVCTKLQVGYQKPLATADFTLFYGDKLGIIGANGCGKSTLVKTLIQKIPALSGSFNFGLHTNLGYFDQDEAHATSSQTLFDNFHDEFPRLTDLQVRTALGAFLFEQEDVFKRVSDLSGGEKVRFALCKMFKRNPNVLVLDEPTNHMDIVGKETFESMLSQYKGTLIVVSHDRYLINKVCNKLFVFPQDGDAFFFEGNYASYEELANKPKQESIQKVKIKKPSLCDQKKQQEKLQKKMTETEKAITTCESQLEEVQNQMCLTEVLADFTLLQPLQQKQEQLQKDLSNLLEQWETLASQME